MAPFIPGVPLASYNAAARTASVSRWRCALQREAHDLFDESGAERQTFRRWVSRLQHRTVGPRGQYGRPSRTQSGRRISKQHAEVRALTSPERTRLGDIRGAEEPNEADSDSLTKKGGHLHRGEAKLSRYSHSGSAGTSVGRFVLYIFEVRPLRHRDITPGRRTFTRGNPRLRACGPSLRAAKGVATQQRTLFAGNGTSCINIPCMEFSRRTVTGDDSQLAAPPAPPPNLRAGRQHWWAGRMQAGQHY